jgi:stress-induced morphogen
MPITYAELEATMRAAFPDGKVVVKDLAGDDDHWSVEIVSPQFAGKNRLAAHRMVQDAVADKNIHALAIKTVTGN